MQFAVAPEVKKLGINACMAIIRQATIVNKNSSLESLKRDSIPKITTTDVSKNKILKEYKHLYDIAGIKGHLPPAEHLITLAKKSGRLPNINTVVDCYNLVSAETCLSIGAHDAAKIKGNILFGMTNGSERYTPLGETKPVRVSPGEYACMDEEKILCRMDIKQCDETKITKDTKEFMVYVQGNKCTEPAYLQKALQRVCALIEQFCGGTCEILTEASFSQTASASGKKMMTKTAPTKTKTTKSEEKKSKEQQPATLPPVKQFTPTLLKSSKLSGKIVVTAALPYANGPIHLGHMVEYIQADIYVRFLKLIGKEAIYCCADDTHGTPIEISAMKEGIPPEQLIERYHREHFQDFSDFLVAFDNYYSTNSEENKHYSEYVFSKLKEQGLIYQKEMELTYCEKCSRFLPDRYVKGRCPKCGGDDQYGDVCEKCNATYTTTDLVDPYCAICGTAPVRKFSRHYFFKLSACSDALKSWISDHPKLQKEVKHYLLNWIKEGLKDWCISRDGPYFGFRIPGEKDKYFYVWLDAPIGYIASTANYAAEHKQNVDDYWKRGQVIHFIGKDIIYFHFLFWPAELMISGFTLPENIIVHGFLTVNGEKMSKSRGTFLIARDYLKVLDPEYLRFYYAANLSPTISDIDLNFDDFKTKVNTELVADLANFAYRTMSFVNKNFDSRVTGFSPAFEEKLVAEIKKKVGQIQEAYESVNYREVVKLILEVSSLGNKIFQEKEPWKLVKTDSAKAQEAVSFCVNLIKDLSILVFPILPRFAAGIQQQLNANKLSWREIGVPFGEHKIGEAKIILRKLEGELDRLKPGPSGEADPFAKADLRVGKILEVKKHPDAEKLFVETIDLGKLGQRVIVSGLAQHYHPDELVGKKVVVVANLQSAKLRGVESQGMLLAGEDAAGNLSILEAPESDVGSQVYVEGILSKPLPQMTFKEFEQVHMALENNVAMYKGKPLKTEFEEVLCERIAQGSVH